MAWAVIPDRTKSRAQVWLDINQLMDNCQYLYDNLGGGGGTPDAIWDADLNTGIQAEESTNENYLRMDINGAEKIVINSTGMGIDEASPSGKLHVNGGFFSNGSATASTNNLLHLATNKIQISNGVTFIEAIYIDNTGNVGINNNSPSHLLDIDGGVSGGGIYDAIRIKHTNSSISGDGPGLQFEGEYLTNSWKFGKIACVNSGTLFGSDMIFYTKDEDNNQAGNLSEKMRITGGGEVGIGETSPTATLEVAALNALSSLSEDADFQIGAKTSANLAFDSNELQSRNNGVAANLLLQKNGGYIGVGVSTPRRQIHVHEDSSLSSLMLFTNSTTGSGTSDGCIVGINNDEHGFLWNYENNHIIFGTNNTEVMRISSAGLVGIGETSPTAKLHAKTTSGACVVKVEHTTASSSGYFNAITNSNSLYMGVESSSGTGILGSGNAYEAVVGTAYSGNLSLWTNSTKRIHITATGGDVGIGQTSPVFRLDIKDDTSGYVAKFFNDGNNANRQGIKIQCGADNGVGQTLYIQALDGNGSQIGQIEQTAGSVFQITDVSDIRIKNNITLSTMQGKNIINNLIIKNFRKFGSVIYQDGLIAQDVLSFFPQAISEYENEKDGNTIYYALAKSELIIPSIKAIQEISQEADERDVRIKSMQIEIKELKEKVSLLENPTLGV